MKRKIISLARSTKVVTLPQKWCEENEISKGDEIDLNENMNSIIISPLDYKLSGYTDMTNMSPMIKRALGAYYKAGFDKITVKLSNKKEFDIIDEVIRDEFIGFEIISSSNTEVVAKSVSNSDVNDFDTMLRRLMLIISSMFEDIILNKNDSSERKNVALRDKDVNKIADFCRRMINKNSLITISKLSKRNPPLYYIIEELEKVSDEVRDLALCEEIENSTEIIKEVLAFYNSFYDLFYRFEMQKISQFGSERYRLRNIIDSEIASYYRKELTICRNIIEKTFDMNGALISINI